MNRFKDRTVVRVEICPNDCIAYYDSVHLTGSYRTRNSHRTACPICGVRLTITDPRTKRVIPAKVIYHFPIQHFVQSLYTRPDLVPHLWTDCGDFEEGHIRRSRGFKAKMLENPHMNS